jgi:hypothetical protein
MKRFYTLFLLSMVLGLLSSHIGYSQATFTAIAGTNNWRTAASWVKVGSSTSTWPGQIAGQTDNAIIPSGSIINLDNHVTNAVQSISVNGTGILNAATRNITVSGNLGGTGKFTVSTGTITINGNVDIATYEITGTQTTNIKGNYSVTTLTETGTGTFIFNGTADQYITAATTFKKLTINKTSGNTLLDADITVSGTLTLTSGLLFLGNRNLTLGSAAGTILGTPGATKMIITDGTGELRKVFTANGNYIFAVGDNTGTAEYSPCSIAFTGTGNDYIGVRVVNGHPLNDLSESDYLNRYWVITKGASWTGGTITPTGTFAAADIIGTAANVFKAYYDGTTWTKTAVLGASVSMAAYNLTSVFPYSFSCVDNGGPSVVSITPNTTVVGEGYIGTGTFSLSVLFSEPMNTSVAPVILFPTEALPSDISVSATAPTWSADKKTYTKYYKVVDNGGNTTNIDVNVTSTQDAVGNAQKVYPYSGNNVFSVDMTNPSVVSVTPSVTMINESHAGTGTFTITVLYDKIMKTDGTGNPTISFPSHTLGATLTFNSVSSGWSDNYTYVASYNVTDFDAVFNNISISVVGAKSAGGNTQNPSGTLNNKFSIDMVGVTISPLTISSNNSNSSSLAKPGDIITVNFTSTEALVPAPTVTIGGLPATVTNSGLNYTASLTSTAAIADGLVSFTVAYSDAGGNAGTVTQINITNGSSVTFDKAVPTNQNSVFASSITVFGGATVTISPILSVFDKIWFAPAGKTAENQFVAGATMTKAANGSAVSILAPANAGTYYLYVIDVAGNVSSATTSVLTVSNIPVISHTETLPLAYVEDNSGTQLTGSFEINDNLDVITSATINISSNYDNSGDKLQFTNTASISGTWIPASGTLSLTGTATKAQYVAAIRSISFMSTSQKPSSLQRTVSVTVNDGAEGNSNTITWTVNVTEVDDAPTFTSTAVTSVKGGMTYVYNIIGADVDDALSFANYSFVSVSPTTPAWLSLTNMAGNPVLTGTAPVLPGAQNYAVILRINDGRGQISEQTFTINVSAYITVNSSGSANYTKIQDAVTAAVDGDQIYVQNGTYFENVVLGSKSIELIGESKLSTIINGGGVSSALCIENSNGKTITVREFTLTNGAGKETIMSSYSPFCTTLNSKFGGGLFLLNTNATLNNMVITGNRAVKFGNIGGSGGGVYIAGSSCSPLLQNVDVTNNTAEGWRGGGVCIEAGATPTLQNVLIDGNSGGNYGGGLSVWKANPILNTVVIRNNTASGLMGRGGGIYLHLSNPSLTNVTDNLGNSATVKGADLYKYKSTPIITGGSIGVQGVDP